MIHFQHHFTEDDVITLEQLTVRAIRTQPHPGRRGLLRVVWAVWDLLSTSGWMQTTFRCFVPVTCAMTKFNSILLYLERPTMKKGGNPNVFTVCSDNFVVKQKTKCLNQDLIKCLITVPAINSVTINDILIKNH